MKASVTLLGLVSCCLLARSQDTSAVLTPQCKVTPDDPDGDCIIGEAGVDYPTLRSVPDTTFSCDEYEYAGVYADVEADCQVFHVCPPRTLLKTSGFRSRPTTTFLCPNGTLFNQEYFVCDWWFNVRCNKATDFYADNRLFYKATLSSNSLLKKANV